MRMMILIFVLAGFVLLAMRSMAQVNLCLLPLEERPDYCTGNAPTVTPVATAAAQPPPELDTYPAPLPYPNAEEQHSPQRHREHREMQFKFAASKSIEQIRLHITWLKANR